ncbi:MAG: hypothetical protein GWN07_31890, partial [Actinobacteria bacterium]|nr:hypothetical protein [Actinomycetota bacterium]NIU70031.1 hypothetical protein [Actinomycetota bacterium]NIV89776.1 hypothetical protein [Actinomycetota bacterium]NIW31905.1 hypothetical protein [Actinomycetota bacterium]NIX24170.1 hypothetical protein [Actinomycetota bacterium]
EASRARAASEEREIPYALLRDLLARRLDIRGDDGIDVVAAKLRSACPSNLSDDQVTSLGRLVGYEMPG